MIAKIISSILVFASSTIKFALGASAVVTSNLGISGTIANVLGGFTGIIVFTYLGGYMRVWLIKRFPERFARKFSRSSRFLVHVKQHFGLLGVAFLTPILLSIPVGVMLALDLTTQKKKIISSMLVSCIFWSVVFFLPYYVFNIDLIGWIKGQF